MGRTPTHPHHLCTPIAHSKFGQKQCYYVFWMPLVNWKDGVFLRFGPPPVVTVILIIILIIILINDNNNNNNKTRMMMPIIILRITIIKQW
jgi:hypothetical protein